MARIAVIGLVGHSMFFDVPRFHVGGETIVAGRYHDEWGGKGFNQAVAAARQNAEVTFLGAVNRADVDALSAFCRDEGIDARLIGKAEPTARAAILTDGTGETRVTVCPGAELDAEDVEAFADAVAAADVLLLGNEVPEAVNLAAVARARELGVTVIFNPAPARPLPQAPKTAVSLFTPNEFEEAAVADVPGEVVTTLGARGCRIRSTGETVPAPAAAAVDSTGAGDTFTAVLATRLAEGESLAAACAAANAAAAQSVAVRYVIASLPRRAPPTEVSASRPAGRKIVFPDSYE
jgi:ribokinase